MSRKVYALFYEDNGSKRYFYVGRSNDVPRRIAEHIRASPKGYENKYERIRELDRSGIAWHVEVLREIPDGEYPPDNERWYVIALTRQGHELTNMRHGSAEHRRELARLVESIELRSVDDVARDRLRKEERTAVRKLGASRRLRHKILKSTLRSVGIPDLHSDSLLPHRLRSRLLREGIDSVGEGVELKRLVRIARPDQAYKDFKAFVQSVEEAHPHLFRQGSRSPGGLTTG